MIQNSPYTQNKLYIQIKILHIPKSVICNQYFDIRYDISEFLRSQYIDNTRKIVDFILETSRTLD